MKEIELLFKINDKVATKIRKEMKKFLVGTAREIDTYFYPPHKDFLVSEHGRENLRVRCSEEKQEFTYKKVIYKNGIYLHSIEKNVDVSDASILNDLLKNVGFRPYITIDKKRETFKENNFIITIDDVKNLGLFVEVEWAGKSGSEKIIKEACYKKANEFGLNKIQDKGYLRLLEEKNKRG